MLFIQPLRYLFQMRKMQHCPLQSIALVRQQDSNLSLIHIWLPGVLTIAVKVLFIPYAILRVVNQLRDEREIVSDINVRCV